MKRKRSMELEVIPTHGHDYSGKPFNWLEFKWVAGDGNHTGRPFLEDVIGLGLGMVPKVGDRVKVTVEIDSDS